MQPREWKAIKFLHMMLCERFTPLEIGWKLLTVPKRVQAIVRSVEGWGDWEKLSVDSRFWTWEEEVDFYQRDIAAPYPLFAPLRKVLKAWVVYGRGYTSYSSYTS